MSLAFIGQSAPNFFLGILLILCFSLWLRLLLSSGRGGWQHLLMPAITLSTYGIASLARLTRSSMLEVLGRDFVRVARAKGLSELRVQTRHVLRNAAIPVLTIFGIQLATAISGAAVTETVFAWLMPPIGAASGSWTHPFGTDQLGRDILSRLIYGTRISLSIGLFGEELGQRNQRWRQVAMSGRNRRLNIIVVQRAELCTGKPREGQWSIASRRHLPRRTENCIADSCQMSSHVPMRRRVQESRRSVPEGGRWFHHDRPHVSTAWLNWVV